MPVSVACPACRKELRVEPRATRSLVPCAGCGSVLTVMQTPAGPQVMAAPKVASGNTTKQPSSTAANEARSQWSNSVSAIAIVGTILLALGGVIISFQWLAGTIGSFSVAASSPPPAPAPEPGKGLEQKGSEQGKTTAPDPAPRDRTPLRTRDLIELVEPSVCSIRTPTGLGTGFVVGPNLVCTNEHVLGLDDESEWQLEFPTYRGRPFRRVTLSYVVVGSDMVLLRVPDLPTELKPLKPISKSELRKGDRLVVIGNPGGLESVVTEGIVGSFQEVNHQTYLQLSVTVNPGNSGGPALNEFGDVAGVVTLKARQEGIGLAIPGDAVQRALKDLQGMSPSQIHDLAGQWKAGQAGAKLLQGTLTGVLLIAAFAAVPDEAADNAESWHEAYDDGLVMSRRVRDTLKDAERLKLFSDLETLFSDTMAAVKQAEEDDEAAFQQCAPLAKRAEKLRRELDAMYRVFDTRHLRDGKIDPEN